MGRKRLNGGTEERHFHVVAVRTDGSAVVLGTGLAMDEAKRVRDALVTANVFATVQFVRGDPQKQRD